MRVLARISTVVGFIALAACAPPPAAPPAAPPDTRAADEAAIRAAVKEWSAAAQAKDVAKFISYYAEGARFLAEGGPDMMGVPSIRDAVGGMMQDPNFALSFTTDAVSVARSGDLAYETGSYTLTLTGPDKKPAPVAGHYVVVWSKQADGTWKAVVDAPVSDGPASIS